MMPAGTRGSRRRALHTSGAGGERPQRLLSIIVRLRWLLWGVALAVGLGCGIALAVLRAHAAPEGGAVLPVETWAAGTRPAPNFELRDQTGRRFSLSSLRGRPVILTFIDPLCRNFCPREATVLSQAMTEFRSDNPVIVAVSVDPWGDSSTSFRTDARHWRLNADWRWGVGTGGALAKVWRNYAVGVSVTTQVLAGITLRKVTHTAATYLIDPSGHIRALLLYPFDTAAVGAAMRTMLATTD